MVLVKIFVSEDLNERINKFARESELSKSSAANYLITLGLRKNGL